MLPGEIGTGAICTDVDCVVNDHCDENWPFCVIAVPDHV